MKIRDIRKTEENRVRLKPYICEAPPGNTLDKPPC